MKKSLLSFFMLMLCIGLLPTATFAQAVTGGESSGGMEDVVDVGGSNVTAPIVINPPSYVSNCKRNNGNGTTAGSAETRLSFSDKNYHPVILIGISNLDGSPLAKGTNVVMNSTANFQRGYNSYALYFNIPPKNKLLFHFSCDGYNFCIPEL